MSGIYGYFQNNLSISINIRALQTWNRAYGEDNHDYNSDTLYGMGCFYERIATAPSCSSPVFHTSKSCNVADALIFNREELIQKYHTDNTFADEKILFHIIHNYGLDCLKDINGDFSGAIYDKQEQSLLLFRDHLGVRPLYYYACDDFIAYSTDIRGLIALPQTNVDINENWVVRALAQASFVNTEDTEFAHIHCVPPGGYIKFSYSNGTLNTSKKNYWEIGAHKVRLANEKAYQEQLKILITDAIKIRLAATPSPAGAELSGGLDSGVIDILINRLGYDCIFYSWSMSPDQLPYADGDERLTINDICEQESITCGYSEPTINFNETTLFGQKMYRTGLHIDPKEYLPYRFAFPPFINTTSIAATANYMYKNGACTIFSGHGGDEGVSHRLPIYDMLMDGEYYHYFKYHWDTTQGQKLRLLRTFKRCLSCIRETRQMLKATFSPPALLNKDWAKTVKRENLKCYTVSTSSRNFVSAGGSRNRLDVTAMFGAYNGVRYLYPYLDYRVIDYAVSIPRHLYQKGYVNRYIFREAFKDIMPESLYNLRIKSNNSKKGIKKEAGWYEKYTQHKDVIIGRLSKDYWAKYLDYDVIDEWRNMTEPAPENIMQDYSVNLGISAMAQFENVIKKCRSIDYDSIQ